MVRLRPTTEDDLEFVTVAEKDNDPFVAQWTQEQHRAALTDSDIAHLIILTAVEQQVGYLILAGLEDTNPSIELKRIVITDKGKGYGSQALRLILKYAFGELAAHRVWLDVKDYNQRAKKLYEAHGFVVEGVLRECLKTNEGYESLIIMAMLRQSYTGQSDLRSTVS